MVKSINVYFDDEEYDELLKIKRELSWHDFIWGIGNLKKNSEVLNDTRGDRQD